MHHAQIDRLSSQSSIIHRLDGRTKLLTTLLLSIWVIAQSPDSVSNLFYYAVWPFAVIVIGMVPIRFVTKHLLLVSPFILFFAAWSLFFDKQPVTITFGPWLWDTTEGVLRCLAILGKFAITVTALITLVATTPFSDLLGAMSKLGMPGILVVQLGFLYRYIFLFVDRGWHVIRARQMRTLRYLGIKTELKTASSMIGNLLITSIDSASNVSLAMQARGFTGNFPSKKSSQLTMADFFFTTAFVVYIVIVTVLTRAGG